MKKMTFLTNPPKRRGRHSTARSSARTRVAAAPRRKRRPPPAGFSSWSAYMASIRPKHAAGRSAATQGASMASKAKKRRHTGRHTSGGGKRRRYRHNPPSMRGLTRGVVPFAIESVKGAGAVVAGKIVVRKARSLIGQKPGSIVGSAVEAVAAIVAGKLAQSVSPKYGALLAIGGIAAPLETLVQQMGIPHVSDSLADDGFLFGGDTGVEMVSAVPDDGTGQLSEFVEGGGAQTPSNLSEYVAGQQAVA